MADKEHLKIDRKAGDNKYLHRDFHVTADIGLSYVGEHYGMDGVKEYLTDFAKSYYLLLANEVKEKGLIAIEDYLKKIFLAEERIEYLTTNLDGNTLNVKISKCPAIEFFKEIGHPVSKWYGETTKTVYAVLAQMAGLKFDLKYYNDSDGSAEYDFIKGEAK